MRTKELDYYLPQELVAQAPAAVRSKSRLLVMNRASGELTNSRFDRIGQYLRAGDCLVLNDTKVVAARFFARRKSGAKLEGLFLSEGDDGLWRVMLRGAGKVREGEMILVCDGRGAVFCEAQVVSKGAGGKCTLRLDVEDSAQQVLEAIGFAPLPPYIKRDTDAAQAQHDRLRYQTVYARTPGAVAAPTAGLHFTDELIDSLKKKGICFAHVTLHVGEGTFRPVSVEELSAHKMHSEWYCVDAANAETINRAKDEGGRVVAVGTTSVRTLESVTTDGRVAAGSGHTELFIRPGYRFGMVDAMVTNFHLPRSTLLALVAAFAGLEETLAAYRQAVEQRYRFYSYGDAMLIL
jgi:S-adenosylmethionine:tRNA ribosyltransferase-isomerase